MTLRRELHDMAQPLASLQCRLEIAQMVGEQQSRAELLDGSLEDLARLTASFSRLRDLIVQASDTTL